MRNLKLLVLAFIFGSTTLFAPERLDDKNTVIRDQIVNLLDNSKFEADENFKVELIEKVNINDLNEREEYWISKLETLYQN